MIIRNLTIAATSIVLGCSSDYSDTEGADPYEIAFEEDVEVGDVSQSARWTRNRTRYRQNAPQVQTRLTADGETISVIVPAPAPVVEMPPGGACGVVDANGAVLSCQPGSFCLSPADGEPGTCQPGLQAPRSDG